MLRTVKLSPVMVKALRNVVYLSDGRMALATHPRPSVATRVALIERGICLPEALETPMSGETVHTLTAQGVNAWVIACRDESVKGCKVDVSDNADDMAEYVPSVEVQGESPEMWAPDYDAPGASECFFGCGVRPSGVWVNTVGATEGVCEAHTDAIESAGRVVYALPVPAPETDAQGVSLVMADWERELLAMGADMPPMVIRDVTGDEAVSLGETVPLANAEYVVTFDPRPVVGIGALTGLERMSLTDARNLVNKAARIPKTGRIIDVTTLAVVDVNDVQPLYVPTDREGDGITGVMTVGVHQERMGFAAPTHYHAPGCRDIQREMKHFGQREGDAFEFAFSSVAELLEFEFGCIASDSTTAETPEWWAEIMYQATGQVRIMPCLEIPAGRVGDSPLVTDGKFFRAGFDRPSAETVAKAQAEIEAHNFNTCDESECVTCAVKLYDACKANHTGDSVCAACDAYENAAKVIPATEENDPGDMGFAETLVTKEYELSVIVDETTGASVSLGWVALTLNAAQVNDWEAVAREYGRVHGTGKPRHGWESIITVHSVADQF